jgi:hypothetical protein
MPASCPSGLTARTGNPTGGYVGLKLRREFQDPEVFAHAHLRRLQALGDSLYRQSGVDQPLIPASSGERIEVSAQIVLEQRFNEELGVLVIVVGTARADDGGQFHHGGLDGGPVSALAGDQGRSRPGRSRARGSAEGSHRRGSSRRAARARDRR